MTVRERRRDEEEADVVDRGGGRDSDGGSVSGTQDMSGRPRQSSNGGEGG